MCQFKCTMNCVLVHLLQKRKKKTKKHLLPVTIKEMNKWKREKNMHDQNDLVRTKGVEYWFHKRLSCSGQGTFKIWHYVQKIQKSTASSHASTGNPFLSSWVVLHFSVCKTICFRERHLISTASRLHQASYAAAILGANSSPTMDFHWNR